MLQLIKGKSMNAIDFLHQKIFGYEMSLAMKNFAKNIFWTFWGVVFNSGILFLMNIVAGRILGPEGYGKYNLVVTLAAIFLIFMLLAMDYTSVKFISSSNVPKDQSQYLSNAFWIFIFSGLIIGGVIFVKSESIAKIINTDQYLIKLAAIFAFLWSAKNLFDAFIKSFQRFKFQALVKLGEGIVAAIFFLILFLVLEKREYIFYAYALMAGMSFLCLAYGLKIGKFIGSFDKAKFSEILPYARSSFIMVAILILAATLDKIFVGKFLGAKNLGIYSAYITATVVFIGQLSIIIENVLGPMVNKIVEKKAIIKKIDRLALLLVSPAVMVIFLVGCLFFSLLGKSYQLDYQYLALFSLAAYFQIMAVAYRSVVASIVKKYAIFAKLSALGIILMVAAFSCLYFQKTISLQGAVYIYFFYSLYYFSIARLSCYLGKEQREK